MAAQSKVASVCDGDANVHRLFCELRQDALELVTANGLLVVGREIGGPVRLRAKDASNLVLTAQARAEKREVLLVFGRDLVEAAET